MRRIVILVLGLFSVCVHAIENKIDISNQGEMVRPIITTLYFADGAYQQNRGNGFVIGNHFFTAFHNIEAAQNAVRKVVELDGVAVQPSLIDKEHDLALFDLPEQLCAHWCNDRHLAILPLSKRVTWVDDVDNITNKLAWRSGTIRNQAYKTAAKDFTPNGCEHNLVIEVDKPFLPGNSGGPVFDQQSGSIVGLIQGSFERVDGPTTGYYKPIACVLERLGMSSS